MFRWLGPASLFFGVFLIALVASTPLDFVLKRAGLERQAIYYERAGGTIWSGRISGLLIAGQPLGEVTLDVAPGALLGGRLAYDIDVDGPAAAGRGRLAVGLDRSINVSEFFADVNVQELRRLDRRLRQAPATLNMSIAELRMDSEMRCRTGAGAVRTDLLESVGEQWRWPGPTMSGALSCASGDLLVAVSNDGGDDEITAEGRLSAYAQTYQVDAQVRTENPYVQQALRALDFLPQGGRFIYAKSNLTSGPNGEGGLR